MLQFDLLTFSDSLIFLFSYLASLYNVFGSSQLNWLSRFKQFSVKYALFHFPFMLICWCSIGHCIFLCFFYVLCVTTAVLCIKRPRYNIRTEDKIQISSQLKHSFGIFHIKLFLIFSAKNWHPC